MKAYHDAQVPDIVVSRLPVYLRELTLMAQEGLEVTSSKEMAQRLGISSAQIRKDLSHFGEFGKQGTGYRIDFLRSQLYEILNMTQEWEVALVGAGDLGHALINYEDFSRNGFRIALVFDNNPQKIGNELDGLTIMSPEQMDTEIRQRQLRVAIIAVPAAAAQSVAQRLVDAGIQAILSYAPITLQIPATVQVQYMDPVVHLQHMTFYVG